MSSAITVARFYSDYSNTTKGKAYMATMLPAIGGPYKTRVTESTLAAYKGGVVTPQFAVPLVSKKPITGWPAATAALHTLGTCWGSLQSFSVTQPP
jgi:hypothetical protein